MKGAFTKAEANLVLEKGRRKVKVKKKLIEAKKKVEMGFIEAGHRAKVEYKASANLVAEKA